jgi:hypothetical protein
MTRDTVKPSSESIVAEAMALMRVFMLSLGNRARLLGFELQIAGVKLAVATALLVVALFLVGTAWAALWLGIAMTLHSIDLGWPAVVGLIFVANAAGAALLLLGALRLARQVSLPATLRQLSFAGSSDDDDVAGDLMDGANEQR